MPLGRHDLDTDRLGRALAEAVAAVGDELRLVDVADYIAYIRNEQLANLQDIVSSSVELSFKPETLTFGWAADYELDWSRPPTIFLAMEFRHHDIWIVFRLILTDDEARVAIDHVDMPASNGDPARETARLIAVIEDAKLPDAPIRRAAGHHGD